ncbi:MAG TPA: AI-2E family transporter [Candidatus Rubrimentiphilum sp.]|nr:AI-2E family transporter [Candidatus Rubrimentiphilum sp.]
MINAAVGTNWRRIAIVVGIIVLFGLALWFAARIPKTMTIFVIALFLASAVHPISKRLEDRRVPRALAISIVFTVLIVIVTGFIVIVMPMLFAQSQALLAKVPDFIKTTETWMLGMRAALQQRFPSLNIPSQVFNVQQFSVEHVTAIFTAGIASVGVLALNVATALFIAISALILSVFMLLNQDQIAGGFAALFPTRRRQTALMLAGQATHMFGSYISGQIIVCTITGVLIAGITAILGFKFALLFGLVSAVSYAIPIVGMIVAHLLGLVLAAPQGPYMIVWVEVVTFTIARISDNILVPRIMGESIGVSPIGVMFAVFAGGELFGLPGLILGIPAAALIKLVWGYFIGPWLHAQIEFADLATPAPPPATALPDVEIVVAES